MARSERAAVPQSLSLSLSIVGRRRRTRPAAVRLFATALLGTTRRAPLQKSHALGHSSGERAGAREKQAKASLAECSLDRESERLPRSGERATLARGLSDPALCISRAQRRHRFCAEEMGGAGPQPKGRGERVPSASRRRRRSTTTAAAAVRSPPLLDPSASSSLPCRWSAGARRTP